jgi:hypothetical protein
MHLTGLTEIEIIYFISIGGWNMNIKSKYFIYTHKKIVVIALLISLIVESVSLALLLSSADVVQAAFVGDGTEESPYQISSVEQLKEIGKGLNKHYILMEDITFEDAVYWFPIGTTAAPFTGSLDGDGHTIKNLLIDSPFDYAAFFGVTSNAKIKNLNFDNVNVKGQNYVAAIIASALANSVIENCTVSGVITGTTNTGGLVGISTGTGVIRNCSIVGKVNGGATTGGLVGQNTGAATYEKCAVIGSVAGTGNVGGFIGRMGGGQIRQSIIKADVTATTNFVGGIAAEIFAASKIISSSHVGTIEGTNYVGGIVGYVSAGGAEILNVKNGGSVTGSLDIVGGIIGDNKVLIIITESMNSATVKGRNYIGGISGITRGNSNFNNNYNRGDIVGTSYVGGIAGLHGTSANYGIRFCYSTGDVSATSYAGGLVGDAYSGILQNSLAMGENITASSSANRVASWRGSYLSALSNNIAYEDMTVTIKGVKQDIKSKNPILTSLDGLNVEKSKIITNGSYLEFLSWDFDKVWKMPAGGNDFPILRNVNPALTDVVVTGIKIDQEEIRMLLDDTAPLTAAIVPADASNQVIIWSSSNNHIASVSNDGQITANAVGTATITAKTQEGRFTTSCTVFVKKKMEITNVALHRNITGDSVSGTNTAANAIDGNALTRWTAKTNTENVNLTIDFSKEVYVEKIQLKEHLNRITNFKLQYFNGSEFIDFYEGTSMGDNFELNYQQFIKNAPITTTKINLLAISTKNPSAGGASIFEFEVYGYETEANTVGPNVPGNLALNQSVTASVTSSSSQAGNAVDGNHETRWLAPNNSVGSWFRIDFKKAVQLNQIKINEAHIRVSAYKLQYHDGTKWVVFHSGTTIGADAVIDFEQIETTKIRLVVTGLKGLNGASISEIEVYHNN